MVFSITYFINSGFSILSFDNGKVKHKRIAISLEIGKLEARCFFKYNYAQNS